MIEPYRVEKIPILKDNFVFILRQGPDCIVVDPGSAKEVLSYVNTHNLRVRAILITHHHWDHVDGLPELLQEHPCPVYGPQSENIKFVTNPLRENDHFELIGLKFQILLLPGHTLGHMAYSIVEKKWLFSGDVLFALGCGRLFEGTPAQMYESLSQLKQLPDETLIFCTHDYYKANKAFCDQQGFDTAEYDSTHPLLLGQEKEWNPFLTAKDLDEFTARRAARNLF